jgi:hypothetical protein
MIEPDDLDQRIRVLAEHLDCERDELSFVERAPQCTIAHGNREYLVLTDDEAEDLADETIRQTVWAFNSDWLADFMPNGILAEHITMMRGDRCEDANEMLTALVEAGRGMDALVERSIAADGRQAFIGDRGDEHDYDGYYIYES